MKTPDETLNLFSLIGRHAYTKSIDAPGTIEEVRVDRHKRVHVLASWHEFQSVRKYWLPLDKIRFVPGQATEWTETETKACINEQLKLQ